jgi:hypothetical protein
MRPEFIMSNRTVTTNAGVAATCALLASASAIAECPATTSPVVCVEIFSCSGFANVHGDPNNCEFSYCLGGWGWSAPGPEKVLSTTWGQVTCKIREGKWVRINDELVCIPNANGLVIGTVMASGVVQVNSGPCPPGGGER